MPPTLGARTRPFRDDEPSMHGHALTLARTQPATQPATQPVTQAVTQAPASERPDWEPGEPAAAVSQIAALIILAVLLHQFARRVPWPRPFHASFLLVSAAAATASHYGLQFLSMGIEGLFTGNPLETRSAHRRVELQLLGVILWAVVVGITYAAEASARAARAESLAARTQLAALRAQIHPHFVFNALHAVVQLIPVDPRRASDAAELVASLLRTSVEETRDEVPLDDEWTFVSRYLEVEHMRFGDRLRVRAELDPALADARVPSFALQTLVENAVRHGAAHRVAPTDVVVTARGTGAELTLRVWNADDEAPARATVRASADPTGGVTAGAAGTGLSRLRERLHYLYGDAARLTCGRGEDGGYEAVLVVPRRRSAA